tara:strand:+ start:249 stop:749 length:501 start_codon:yes stop_codon:yes gene_type:complete
MNSENPVDLLLRQMNQQKIQTAIDTQYLELKAEMKQKDLQRLKTRQHYSKGNRTNNDNEDSKHSPKVLTRLNTWKGAIPKSEEQSAKDFFAIQKPLEKTEIEDDNITNLMTKISKSKELDKKSINNLMMNLLKKKATDDKNIKKGEAINSALFDKISKQPVFMSKF